MTTDPGEETPKERLDRMIDDLVAQLSHEALSGPPAAPRCPDQIPADLAEGAWSTSAPDDPPAGMGPDLWPEDVLSDTEWNRGWFARKVLAGELDPDAAATIPEAVGGTMPNPSGRWMVQTKRPPQDRTGGQA